MTAIKNYLTQVYFQSHLAAHRVAFRAGPRHPDFFKKLQDLLDLGMMPPGLEDDAEVVLEFGRMGWDVEW